VNMNSIWSQIQN